MSPAFAHRLRVGDGWVQVGVRPSVRARRASLRVGPGRPPELVVPAGTPAPVAVALLEREAGWLGRRLAELDARAAGIVPLGLDRAGRAWIDGAPVPVRQVPGRRPLATLARGAIEVGGARGDAAAAVERLLRREARRRLADAVDREAGRLGLSPSALSVRDQRTRWGSCTRAGALSFSWRLVMVPPAVRDSVVVHELCHLVRADHSPAFWSLLDEARPGWRAQAAWLDDHAPELLGHRIRLGP